MAKRNMESPFPFAVFEGNFRRYGAATIAMALAVLAQAALAPLFHGALTYITLFPAVVFSALFCGLAPSIVTTLAALVALWYFFIEPVHSFGLPDAPQLTGIFIFLAASTLVLIAAEVHRRSKEALWNFQKDLEARVQERTAELHTANHSLSDLTARLLHLQDEERRRLARELHDSVGQSLAALTMNLSALKSDIERISKAAGKVSDSVALVNDITTDIRTVSHLLHPPLLDEAGLASALRVYTGGFMERSKIHVDMQLPDDSVRLPQDIETAVFRLVQECLTNIHRHSESPVAKIRILASQDGIHVEIEDQGKGIPPEKLSELLTAGKSGVGIRGMRERVRQLGGTLEIISQENRRGTKVIATFPSATAPTPQPPLAQAAGAGAS
jgi:signal transduction histidine kinase